MIEPDASPPAELDAPADVLADDDGVALELEVALDELELPHPAMATAKAATTATGTRSGFFIRIPPGIRAVAIAGGQDKHMSYYV
ncbi:MAG TPA: hypothetical protein VHN36_12440 [Ilumatobacteraceae bacterium]|nr:hypothetical protein [Ilumatobacteraceae bacterium]